ncbi:MAG TPA: hypothetical protein DCW96_07300 [Stenotrophomonas sp.]|nr:hypothetical protein [Stenotrophomonas sp.]
MTAHLIVLVLIGCTVAIAYGVAVLPRNLRDTIEAARPNPAREAQAQAEALAELFRNEIDATKRGDLLAAAGFAERAEVIRG